MSATIFETLKLTQTRGICTVSLNRPEKRNAFFPPMIKDITTAFKSLAKDQSVRAVLLTGEGASFCAGGDLEWMRSMADFSFQQNLKDAERLFDMYFAIRQCSVPILGKIRGHAFGGGAGLLAVCDVVAVESQTQISFSEVKWGLVPAVISPFVCEKAAPAKVREWFLTAKVFSASEALHGGLIHFAGEISAVDDYLQSRFQEILSCAPEAVRETKKLHLQFSPLNFKKIKPLVTKLIAQRRVSDEGQKGLEAFLEKRTPQWSRDGAAAKEI